MSFNADIVRKAALIMVISMLFGLFGCGNRQTPEQTAQQYLEKKYSRSFVVEELTKKSGGPFKTQARSGYAYEAGRPLERFTVWVDSDGKTVADSYYCVAMLPAIDGFIRDTAEQVWPSSRTAVTVNALRHNSSADYRPEDYRTFLEEESAECYVYLAIDANALTEETYAAFSDALKTVMDGNIRIYLMSEAEQQTLDLNTLIERNTDAVIRIGASRTVIGDALRELRGE